MNEEEAKNTISEEEAKNTLSEEDAKPKIPVCNLQSWAEEADVLADTLALKEAYPAPHVVSIVGNWGAGKNITKDFIMERLKGIQKLPCDQLSSQYSTPFAGHLYVIKFSSWTYSKSNLWASLMNKILTEMNDQLKIEELLKWWYTDTFMNGGVSVLEILENMHSGDYEYLNHIINLADDNDEPIPDIFKDFKLGDMTASKALAKAINVNYEEDLKALNELNDIADAKKDVLIAKKVLFDAKKEDRDLFHFLTILKENNIAWDDVNNSEDIQTSLDGLNIFEKYWIMYKAGKIELKWVILIIVGTAFVVALPYMVDWVSGGFSYFGIPSILAGVALKIKNAEKLIAPAMGAYETAYNEKDEDSENRAFEEEEAEMHKDLEEVNEKIDELDSKVWLKDGDDIRSVIRSRTESNDYGSQLGTVHQAHGDLMKLADTMKQNSATDGGKENWNRMFPRGPARIVLIVDNLDLCPPEVVVETLQAIQLLVRSKMFSILLPIDDQYVTLALEKHYDGILQDQRHPSGQDYLSNIVNVAYRVPQLRNDDEMRVFLDSEIHRTLVKDHRVEQYHKLPQEVLNVSAEENELMRHVCISGHLTPHFVRVLVDTFKMMKIVWYRRGLREKGRTVSETIKKASVLLLAMSASKSKKMRGCMRLFFAEIEWNTSGYPYQNLNDMLSAIIGEEEHDVTDERHHQFLEVFMTIKHYMVEILTPLSYQTIEEWEDLQEDLRLVKSFAIVEDAESSPFSPSRWKDAPIVRANVTSTTGMQMKRFSKGIKSKQKEDLKKEDIAFPHPSINSPPSNTRRSRNIRRLRNTRRPSNIRHSSKMEWDAKLIYDEYMC